MTALTVYVTSVATTTLSTAGALASTTGGTIVGTASKIGTSTGYGEVYGLGTSNAWSAAGSIGTPSGNGWLWDVTTLEAKTLSSGTWTPTIRIRVSNGTATADLYVRYYKRSSGGVYTNIGTVSTTGVALTTGFLTPSFSASLSSMEFNTGDKLYMDVWLNITANSTGTSTATVFITTTSSATQGDTTGAQTTPGYVATTRALSSTIHAVGTLTGRLIAPYAKINAVGTLTATTSIQLALSKTINATGTLSATMAIAWKPRITMSAVGTMLPGLSPVQLFCTINAIGTVSPSLIVGSKGIIIYISGIPYIVSPGQQTFYVLAGTLQVQKAIGRRSTASFQVHSDTSIHFQEYQPVSIYDNGVLTFSGFISPPKEHKPGFQNSLIHDIQCIDNHYLADKRIIAASYANMTPGAIARDIITKWLASEGVTVGQIYDTALYPSETLYPSPNLYPSGTLQTIPSVVFGYCTVAQAFDSLVTRANANGTPYYWQIDENRKFWFVPYTAIQNPTVIDGTQIERKANPTTVTRSNPSFRNKQYIIGGVAQTVLQHETRKGDSNTQSWAMGYDISTAPTIKVDNVTKTVGVKGIDTGKDFYWALGDPNITQDSNATKLTSSNTLDVLYIGQYETVIVSEDFGLVSTQQQIEGNTTTGIVESVINDTAITSLSQGFAYGSSLLARYGVQGIILNFFTLDLSYKPGQLVTVNLPMHGLTNQQMLIESSTLSDGQDSINIWNNVIAVSGPYDNTWVDFFGRLLEDVQQTPLQVGISQTISLAVPLSITLKPTATLTVIISPVLYPSETLYPAPNLYP